MIVEYIQPVCPYCNRGLYVPTVRGDTADEYYCREHGDIEPRLVRYVLCPQVDGSVLLPAAFEVQR